MGALVASILIQGTAVVALLIIGYFFPNAFATTVTELDNLLATLAENSEPTGTLKLIFQVSGAGFAVLVGLVTVLIGFVCWSLLSNKFFRWRRIITAGLIPLLAHAVRWGLGLLWPALLVPVQQLADRIIGWFDPSTQVTLGLFHARDHLMTIIIGVVLMVLWSLIKLFVRRIFRRPNNPPGPTPTPQPPTGRRRNIMKKLLNFGWRLVTLPFRLVWWAIKWPFTRDIVVGPITWTIILVAIALSVGYGVSLGLAWLGDYSVQKQVLNQNPFQGVVQYLFAVLIAIVLLQPDLDKTTKEVKIFTVPGPAKGAQVSWIGKVTPFVLETGTYPIIGKFLGFGWLKIEPSLKDGKEASRTIADKDGFIILGDITFQVWNSAGAETKAEQTTITLPAKNTAPVSGSLSFVLKGLKRIRWVKASDTGLELGNRARQELQEILEWFVDTDVKSMVGHMLELFKGSVLVTAMMPKDVGRYKTGSMIRDEQGKPLFRIVKDPTEEKVEAAMTAFIVEDLANSADPQMLEAISKKKPGEATEIRVVNFKAENSILDVITQRGFELLRVMFDSVRMSEEVERAAKQASSEADERTAQLASARANAEARAILMPNEEELKNLDAWQFTTTLQAANDSKNGAVRVVMIPSAGQLTRELVGANLITGDDKK